MKKEETLFRDLLKGDERFLEVANATFGLELKEKVWEVVLVDEFDPEKLNSVERRVGDEYLVMLYMCHKPLTTHTLLRMFIHTADTLFSTKSGKDCLEGRSQKLIMPIFATFYDGDEPFPEEKTLELFESSKSKNNENTEDAEGTEDEDELSAAADEQGDSTQFGMRVFNINYSPDKKILKASKTLKEYSILRQNIGECKKAGEKDYIKKGVLKTIEAGVLKEYLETDLERKVAMLKAEEEV